jgi:hypothetical protein
MSGFPERKLDADTALAESFPLPPPPKPSLAEELKPIARCWVCGRGPAQSIILARNTGMIFVRQWESMSPVVCRSHGIRLSARWLGYTLVLGWWGVISFFANFFAVGADLRALGRALFMPRPE